MSGFAQIELMEFDCNMLIFIFKSQIYLKYCQVSFFEILDTYICRPVTNEYILYLGPKVDSPYVSWLPITAGPSQRSIAESIPVVAWLLEETPGSTSREVIATT